MSKIKKLKPNMVHGMAVNADADKVLLPYTKPKHVRVIVEFNGVPVWERWQQENGQCGGLGTTNTRELTHIITAMQESTQQAESLKRVGH